MYSIVFSILLIFSSRDFSLLLQVFSSSAFISINVLHFSLISSRIALSAFFTKIVVSTHLSLSMTATLIRHFRIAPLQIFILRPQPEQQNTLILFPKLRFILLNDFATALNTSLLTMTSCVFSTVTQSSFARLTCFPVTFSYICIYSSFVACMILVLRRW